MATGVFSDRYLNGEREAVCRELREVVAFDEATLGDARHVANIIVDRSRHNLQHLHSTLVRYGYAFNCRESSLRIAEPSDVSLIESVEATVGSLPIILQHWYRRLGSVDFTQDVAQMSGFGRSVRQKVSGLGFNTPLVCLSLTACLELRQRLQNDAKKDGGRALDGFFPLGGWASNCEPKGVEVPNRRFDCEIYNDGAGKVYFIDELRNAFRWGGFPFWRSLMATTRNRAYPLRWLPEFKELLPTLLDGLLAI